MFILSDDAIAIIGPSQDEPKVADAEKGCPKCGEPILTEVLQGLWDCRCCHHKRQRLYVFRILAFLAVALLLPVISRFSPIGPWWVWMLIALCGGAYSFIRMRNNYWVRSWERGENALAITQAMLVMAEIPDKEKESLLKEFRDGFRRRTHRMEIAGDLCKRMSEKGNNA